MFNWEKKGRVFNPEDVQGREWLDCFAQGPATLIFDEFVRVYFSTRPKPDSKGQFVSYSAFLDLDRSNLKRVLQVSKNPILQLGERGSFDEYGVYPVSVIRDKEKVYAYYGGWTRCESVPFNVAVGCAVSTDSGQTFERVGEGPILSHSIDEPFIISGPKIRKFNDVWYLFYIAGRKWVLDAGKPEPVYRIRMASSTDGISWNKYGSDLIDPVLGNNEAQASPDVFYKDGMFHMYFCYRHGTGYRGHARGYRIGYAYSHDLHSWHRKDGLTGLDVSDQGWDSEMVAYPHVFNLDESWYMFYLGNQVGRCGFGLAELVE